MALRLPDVGVARRATFAIGLRGAVRGRGLRSVAVSPRSFAIAANTVIVAAAALIRCGHFPFS